MASPTRAPAASLVGLMSVSFPIAFVLGAFVGLAAVCAFGAGIYAILRVCFPYKPRFADLV
jgi:hypothetical protein